MHATGSGKGGVALLAEGVDRNIAGGFLFAADLMVALLAEGVDRNTKDYRTEWTCKAVALLAEGVDRNTEALD